MINWSGALQGAWPADGKDAPSADWCRTIGRIRPPGGFSIFIFLFRDRRLEVSRHLSGRLFLHRSACDAAGGCVFGHGRALSFILGGQTSRLPFCFCFYLTRMSSPLFRGQLVGVPLEIMHPTMEKDTTYTKIFVGGLPYHTNDASLRKYFESFGDIDEAVVITDKQTGKSRGYGFVSENETHFFWCRGGGVQSWGSGEFYATSRPLICVIAHRHFVPAADAAVSVCQSVTCPEREQQISVSSII